MGREAAGFPFVDIRAVRRRGDGGEPGTSTIIRDDPRNKGDPSITLRWIG